MRDIVVRLGDDAERQGLIRTLRRVALGGRA